MNCLIDRCGVPKLVESGKTSNDAKSNAVSVSKKRYESWTLELRDVFAKLINKKALKLTMVDYDSFFEYYTANTSGNVGVSKRISDERGGKRER